MNNLTPLKKPKSLGLTHLNENFANFPVIILDYYAHDLLLSYGRNDVLTQYKFIIDKNFKLDNLTFMKGVSIISENEVR